MAEKTQADAPKYSFDVDTWFENNRDSIKGALEKAAAGYVASGGDPADLVDVIVTITSEYSDGVGAGKDSFDLEDCYHEVEEEPEATAEAAPSNDAGDGVSGE